MRSEKWIKILTNGLIDENSPKNSTDHGLADSRTRYPDPRKMHLKMAIYEATLTNYM